jgi:hypothetical protein
VDASGAPPIFGRSLVENSCRAELADAGPGVVGGGCTVAVEDGVGSWPLAAKMFRRSRCCSIFSRPSEGLWQFRCSVASAHGLYPQVQLLQQAVDCFGDFRGNRL